MAETRKMAEMGETMVAEEGEMMGAVTKSQEIQAGPTSSWSCTQRSWEKKPSLLRKSPAKDRSWKR